ncbi:hypothetical protein AXXA_27885 [Achromobacter insuavis AXX-A]|uniref:Uncharacterized protein n=1 Tax=Achromobacter insuavis AXX-A TaxID=1003200 RepID=F7T9D1_9BURK|nr:hypothetical protein AXXA_27885 [Achromobacter insuavis AXX-A]
MKCQAQAVVAEAVVEFAFQLFDHLDAGNGVQQGNQLFDQVRGEFQFACWIRRTVK